MSNYDKKLEILKKILSHLWAGWTHYERINAEIAQWIDEESLTYYVDTLNEAIHSIHDEKKKEKMLQWVSRLQELHTKELERKVQDERELDDILSQIDSL